MPSDLSAQTHMALVLKTRLEEETGGKRRERKEQKETRRDETRGRKSAGRAGTLEIVTCATLIQMTNGVGVSSLAPRKIIPIEFPVPFTLCKNDSNVQLTKALVRGRCGVESRAV